MKRRRHDPGRAARLEKDLAVGAGKTCDERGFHRWVRYDHDATRDHWYVCRDCGASTAEAPR